MPKIMVVEPIHQAGMEILRRTGEVYLASDTQEETLCRECREADAILVRSSPLSARVIEAAAKLKVIARHGIGTDHIDVQAATAKGILVLNTPHSNVNSVAEHAFALILACAKNLLNIDRRFREGRYFKTGSLPGIVSQSGGVPALELAGKQLGLIGAGKIARRVAEIARVLRMRVAAYDPYVEPEVFSSLGITPVSLEELMGDSDFVSLHLPLTAGTRGLIGREEIARMKSSAFLINTARGAIVKEDALVEALNSYRIRGAAVDVFAEENPNPAKPLFSCPNIILTPHMASLTDQSLLQTAIDAATGIADLFSQRRPQFIVNPEALR